MLPVKLMELLREVCVILQEPMRVRCNLQMQQGRLRGFGLRLYFCHFLLRPALDPRTRRTGCFTTSTGTDGRKGSLEGGGRVYKVKESRLFCVSVNHTEEYDSHTLGRALWLQEMKSTLYFLNGDSFLNDAATGSCNKTQKTPWLHRGRTLHLRNSLMDQISLAYWKLLVGDGELVSLFPSPFFQELQSFVILRQCSFRKNLRWTGEGQPGRLRKWNLNYSVSKKVHSYYCGTWQMRSSWWTVGYMVDMKVTTQRPTSPGLSRPPSGQICRSWHSKHTQ